MNQIELNAEAQVRQQVEDWARAVSRQILAAIVVRHSSDMLMFDLPAAIVRGIDAYKQTWDSFFTAPQGPISFRLASYQAS